MINVLVKRNRLSYSYASIVPKAIEIYNAFDDINEIREMSEKSNEKIEKESEIFELEVKKKKFLVEKSFELLQQAFEKQKEMSEEVLKEETSKYDVMNNHLHIANHFHNNTVDVQQHLLNSIDPQHILQNLPPIFQHAGDMMSGGSVTPSDHTLLLSGVLGPVGPIILLGVKLFAKYIEYALKEYSEENLEKAKIIKEFLNKNQELLIAYNQLNIVLQNKTLDFDRISLLFKLLSNRNDFNQSEKNLLIDFDEEEKTILAVHEDLYLRMDNLDFYLLDFLEKESEIENLKFENSSVELKQFIDQSEKFKFLHNYTNQCATVFKKYVDIIENIDNNLDEHIDDLYDMRNLINAKSEFYNQISILFEHYRLLSDGVNDNDSFLRDIKISLNKIIQTDISQKDKMKLTDEINYLLCESHNLFCNTCNIEKNLQKFLEPQEIRFKSPININARDQLFNQYEEKHSNLQQQFKNINNIQIK